MHARKTHGLRYPLKWYQTCPSTKSKTCLGMIQVSRKKMLCAKRQRVRFCRGFFLRHETKWKNTALHPWSNKHHKHPPSFSLPSSWHRIAKNYIRRSIWAFCEDERPCDQGEGENLKLLRLQNSFHYRSASKIFQTCSVDFGSNITLIALIAILDKVWGLEDLLSMAAWFSRHTLKIPHIWWLFFFGLLPASWNTQQ